MDRTFHDIGENSDFPFSYEELAFESWIELRNYLISWKEQNPLKKHFFRGHGQSDWKLIPTIERIRPSLEDTFWPAWYKKAEELSIGNYRRSIHLFGPPDISKLAGEENDLNWLSIMQHHGAATRLLDVSESPFIAAFFAFNDISSVLREKCIWAIPFNIIDEVNEKHIQLKTSDTFQELYDHYQTLKVGNSEGQDIIGYSFSKNPSQRHYTQQSAFLYSMSNEKDFSTLIGKYYNSRFRYLTKLTIKISSRPVFSEVVNDLKAMNITYSSLFPGIDGYGKDILLYQYIINT